MNDRNSVARVSFASLERDVSTFLYGFDKVLRDSVNSAERENRRLLAAQSAILSLRSVVFSLLSDDISA
jgi:hypothetical protein